MSSTNSSVHKNEPVCITGANGFIGSWLVQTLLDHSYTTIHATIYPGSSTSHLHALPGASQATLVFHEADLLDAQALSKAIEGCSGVFHVASPCSLDIGSSERFASLILRLRQWYPVSKTLAEKSAWKFADKNGLDVVTILPSTCLGRLLQPSLNPSCAVLQQLLQGSRNTQEYHWLGAVHVKDVAKAQVLLFETPRASGRYLCTAGIYHYRVSRLFPEFDVHRFEGETQPGMVSCEDAAKRLIDMGMVFMPVEDAVKETVESLKSKRLLVS